MGRKARYPTPEKARADFEEGVELAREKWVTRAKEGADDYQTWYAGFAATVYPIIATLPPKTEDPVKNWLARGARIVTALKALSRRYRATKLETVAREARALAERAAPLITVRG
jgi:predicted oxidoreductase